MSIRVTDPAGEDWIVTREWLGLPRWTRFEGDAPSDLPWVDGLGGDDVGGLAAVAVIAAVILVLLVLWFVVLPLVVFLLGLLAALLALSARLLSISAWTIRVRGVDTTLFWRVRGMRRSRRAMQELAAMLGRGEEPRIAGLPGSRPPAS